MHRERRPNPGRSPESLEARLRALPQPPVPAGLETRLLADIPARRRWAGWVGAAGAFAAACVLVALAWPRRADDNPAPGPGPGAAEHQVTRRPPDAAAGIAAWREGRRVLEGAEPRPFSWPLRESSPVRVWTAIPPDLLD
jgi:hypothetical protein